MKPPRKLPGMLPSPPQDDHDDGDDGIFQTHYGVHRVAHADEHAGDAGHRGTQAETQGQHIVNIDTHQPRRGRVLGRRPDGFAGAREIQKQVEGQTNDDGNPKSQQTVRTK